MRSLAIVSLLALPLAAQSRPALAWQEWSTDLFAQAEREHRLVLLHLGAVWCHWCHVMEHETYEDAQVIALVQKGYLPVKVDQDARPDLANRYQDYGWPATIIFDQKGKELAKLRGYLPPARMRGLLQAFLDDPTPGPSITPAPKLALGAASALAAARRQELEARFAAGWDEQHGGIGRVHKFLDADSVEYQLERARGGDAVSRQRAERTLAAELALLDPVWGGAYQYSDSGVWTNPHFEKIVPRQVADLRAYALAYAATGDERWLAPIRAIRKYLLDFLRSPDGTFYVSQDADVVPGQHSAGYFGLDDEKRRAQGMPRVDRHVYARENGLVFEALALCSSVLGEPSPRDAVTACDWILANRRDAKGLFRHDEKDAAGPYLADSLAMGRALWMLYRATQWPVMLRFAEKTARAIDAAFAGVGVPTAPGEQPDFDENVALARFALTLHRATGSAEHRALAERALRWLCSPGVAEKRGAFVAGLLLAEREAAEEPVHVTVIGARADGQTIELLCAARKAPVLQAIVDCLAPEQAETANLGYPKVSGPTAFLCRGGACSAPITGPGVLLARLRR